jgi:putative transposase
VTPSAKREAVSILVCELGLSVRRACRIVRFSRAAHYRMPAAAAERDHEVITALQRVLEKSPRAGFWKCFRRTRATQRWNHKRVHRVYCALKLNLPRRTKRRVPTRLRQPLVAPRSLNEVWALDFMTDALYSGRKLRTFNALDEGNREALGIEVATSIPSMRVTRVLDELIEIHGKPAAFRIDNGPELTSKLFQAWCRERGIELRYIQPGKPDQNASIERFNRSYREDVLDAYAFASIEEVRAVTEEWLEDYNSERPHYSLGGLPPRAFMPRPNSFRGDRPLVPRPRSRQSSAVHPAKVVRFGDRLFALRRNALDARATGRATADPLGRSMPIGLRRPAARWRKCARCARRVCAHESALHRGALDRTAVPCARAHADPRCGGGGVRGSNNRYLRACQPGERREDSEQRGAHHHNRGEHSPGTANHWQCATRHAGVVNACLMRRPASPGRGCHSCRVAGSGNHRGPATDRRTAKGCRRRSPTT